MQLVPSAALGRFVPRLRPAVVLGVALAMVLAAASPAAAKPVVPGATPLWLSSQGFQKTRCPKADDLTGSTRRAYVAGAKSPKQRLERAFSILFSDGALPQPVVLLCDPEMRAQERFMGGITGQSALITTDQVFWGQRSLGGAAEDGGAAGLRAGDQLALPAAGTSATLDVTVAAGDSTSTVRVPTIGLAPTGIRIAGTVAAPSVIVSDAAGERTVPVPIPARTRFALKITRDGNRLRGRFTTNPGAIVLFGTEDEGDARIGAASGRQVLKTTIKRSAEQVFVVVYDPATRASWTVTCKAPLGKPVRCKKPNRDLGALLGLLLGFATSSGPPHRLTETATAADARATRLAPASITKIGDDDNGRATPLAVLPGDLNGDGRPDGWRRSFGEGKLALLVSTPAGTWRGVDVTGAQTSRPSELPALPDLSGDGRAEIIGRDGVLITDGFAGPALPSTIDLGRKRQPSNLDLLPGGNDDLFAPTLVANTPTNAIADITGDGRPELVLDDTGALATLPSEAVPPGRLANRADVVPSGIFEPSLFASSAASDNLSNERTEVESDARTALSHRVVTGRLFTVSPVDRSAVSAAPQPIVLEERRADGAVIASRTFSAAGWPILLDVDPVSGDALVQMAPAKRCPKAGKSAESGFNTRRCTDHILRVDVSGAVRSDVTDDRASDEPVSAIFAPDGGDADDRLEVLMALTGGLNPGELKLLGSTVSGAAKLDALPTVDLEGKRRDDLVQALEAVVLPNGSRWAVITTSPVTSEFEEASGELLIVEPK